MVHLKVKFLESIIYGYVPPLVWHSEMFGFISLRERCPEFGLAPPVEGTGRNFEFCREFDPVSHP